MSKLRARLRLLEITAEQKVDPATGYYILEDGTLVDPATGEVMGKQPVTEQSTTEQPATNDSNEFKDKLKNVMYDEVKNAQSDYPDSKYLNQWGKVSPINIMFIDDINSIYGMTPEQAKTFIINKIKELNKKYGNDKTYGYVSQDYLANMSSKLRTMKTIDKIVQYLTDAYFKGAGMGMSPNKKTSMLIDLDNKEALKVLLPILTKMANKQN